MKTIIEHNIMARIALYFASYNQDEALTQELFQTTFGNVMGDHYWTKWVSTYKRDFMKMIVYFGMGSHDGAKFCEMVEVKMAQYESRIGRMELVDNSDIIELACNLAELELIQEHELLPSELIAEDGESYKEVYQAEFDTHYDNYYSRLINL